MAKTKTISITSTNNVFNIKPSAATANYVYDSLLDGKQNVSFNADTKGTKYTGHRSLTYKKDNDLVVLIKFTKGNAIKKNGNFNC